MRADQVADFAVALVAPAANEVSGQIFVVRGSELFVFNQPRPVRGIARDWTPETILDQALPEPKATFTGLQPSAVRSEERRVGNECVSKMRFRWSQYY